eukprot:6179540-Pleurochrysis_carterae.AAC.6
MRWYQGLEKGRHVRRYLKALALHPEAGTESAEIKELSATAADGHGISGTKDVTNVKARLVAKKAGKACKYLNARWTAEPLVRPSANWKMAERVSVSSTTRGKCRRNV